LACALDSGIEQVERKKAEGASARIRKDIPSIYPSQRVLGSSPRTDQHERSAITTNLSLADAISYDAVQRSERYLAQDRITKERDRCARFEGTRRAESMGVIVRSRKASAALFRARYRTARQQWRAIEEG